MASQKKQIIEELYFKINDVIGGGNQLFSMMFPGQSLNHKMYSYDTSDRNSVITKPYVVSEAEFKLSDQLYDISPIITSSNGEKLSTTYKTLINNYIPKLDHLSSFIRNRAEMSKWLTESTDVDDAKSASSRKLTRLELCKELYNNYLEQKNKWNEEKDSKYKDYKKENDLDGYAKWQSSFGTVRNEQLNNLYNDVVVRGHLHEVLTILGYLNASSIAEEIELTKQKMRSSSRLSLDESLTIYPVQFSPNNWFKALTPNLNPEDLINSVESIQTKKINLEKQLKQLKDKLNNYNSAAIDSSLIKRLESDIANSKKKVEENENKLINQYGNSLVGITKIFLSFKPKTAGQKAADTFSKLVEAKDQNALDLLGEAVKDNFGSNDKEIISCIEKIADGIATTADAQGKLTASIQELTQLQALKIEMESKDFQLKKNLLEQSISDTEMDLRYYSDLYIKVNQVKYNKIPLFKVDKNIYTFNDVRDRTFVFVDTIKNTTSKEIKFTNSVDELNNLKSLDPELATLPNFIKEGNSIKITLTNEIKLEEILPFGISSAAMIKDPEIENLFTDIMIDISSKTMADSKSSRAESSSSSTKVSLWFSSYASKESSSSASSSEESYSYSQDMQIGLRVAKVGIDRGGWFNPTIFKMSESFYKLANIKASNGINLSNLDKLNANLSHAVLPSFPTAFVIAKDITIKIKTNSSNSSTTKSQMEKEMSKSGGFLCFSCSSSSSSKSSNETAIQSSDSTGITIRIPGPQILGYYQEFVPEDRSIPYDDYVKAGNTSLDFVDALRTYDKIDFTKENAELEEMVQKLLKKQLESLPIEK